MPQGARGRLRVAAGGRLRLAAAAVLFVALAVRLGAVAGVDLAVVNDPADYVRHGEAIAAAGSYPQSNLAAGPTAIRPPAYPLLLGGAFALAGDDVRAGRVANALVGTLVVALVGLLAAAVLGGRAGLAAAAIAAVYPPLVAAGATLMSEVLFTAFVLAAVLAALRGGALRWAVAAGVLAGLAILTRANGAVVLAPLVLGLWGRPWRSRAALARPLACVAAAALVVAPWTVRNLVVLDSPVLVSTSAPYTLAGTYNETARGDERFPAAWRPPTLDPAYGRVFERTAGLGEVARGRELRRTVQDFVAEHPLYPLEATARNLVRYAHLDGLEIARVSAVSDGLPAWTGTAGAAGFALVAVAALAAVVARRPRPVPAWVWLVPVVLLAGVAPTVTAIRFRVPADPFLILAAAGMTAAGARESS